MAWVASHMDSGELSLPRECRRTQSLRKPRRCGLGDALLAKDGARHNSQGCARVLRWRPLQEDEPSTSMAPDRGSNQIVGVMATLEGVRRWFATHHGRRKNPTLVGRWPDPVSTLGRYAARRCSTAPRGRRQGGRGWQARSSLPSRSGMEPRGAVHGMQRISPIRASKRRPDAPHVPDGVPRSHRSIERAQRIEDTGCQPSRDTTG